MIGREAVALVDGVPEPIASTFDGIQICVGEPDPFSLDLLLRLFPVPLDLIPIHLALPNSREASSAEIKAMTHAISRAKPWLVRSRGDTLMKHRAVGNAADRQRNRRSFSGAKYNKGVRRPIAD